MRALMAAVVLMGVMIVAGVITLGTLLLRRANTPFEAANHAIITLPEPAGTHLGPITPIGPDRIAISLTGGGPDRAVILDLHTGQPITRITLAPAPSLERTPALP